MRRVVLAVVLVAAVVLGISPGAAPGREQAPAGGGIAVTALIPTNAGPTGVGFGHGLLWVTRDNDTVARVNPRTGRIVGRTHVGGFPVRVAVGARFAWVANSAGDSVSQLDARTGRRLRTVAVGDRPSGVALAAGAVWVVCAGDARLFRLDPATARVVARIPIGEPPTDPPSIAAGPGGVWITRLDRVVQVDPRRNLVAATVLVRSPTDVAAGRDLWVASLERSRITRINPRSHAVSGSYRVGNAPSGVALAMGRVWVLDNADSTVSEVDPVSGHTLARIAVGSYSYDIAVGGGAVWAQSYGEQAVYEVQPVSPIRTGSGV